MNVETDNVMEDMKDMDLLNHLTADSQQPNPPIQQVIRVVEFSRDEHKIFEDQHTQRKLFNFANWCSGEVPKNWASFLKLK